MVKLTQKIAVSILVCAVLTLAFGALFLPAAFATHGIGPEPVPLGKELPKGPTTGALLLNTITFIADWIFVILLIFATIFIVLAAFQFVTAGGDPSAVAQARMKLLYAVIGVAVAAVAKGLPIAVRHIIGV